MNKKLFGTLRWAMLLTIPVMARAQAENRPPREFAEFRGTWLLDETAGHGNISGLPVPATIEIGTTPTEISLKKDSAQPEVYRIDGTETVMKDARTGVPLDRSFRFTLVADALAFTTRQTKRQPSGLATTNIITDAYSVAGTKLTVERQLSVLVEPPGNLATLENAGNSRQTIVYWRAPRGYQK